MQETKSFDLVVKSAFSLSTFSLLLPGNDFGLACQIITKISKVEKISSCSSYKKTFLSFSKLFYYDSFYTEKYVGKCNRAIGEDTRIKRHFYRKDWKKQDVKKHYPSLQTSMNNTSKK